MTKFVKWTVIAAVAGAGVFGLGVLIINAMFPPTPVVPTQVDQGGFKPHARLETNQKIDLELARKRAVQVGIGCDLLGAGLRDYRKISAGRLTGFNSTSWFGDGSGGVSTLVGSPDGWLLDISSYYPTHTGPVEDMKITSFSIGALQANLHLDDGHGKTSDCGPVGEKPRPSDWEYYQRVVGEQALNLPANDEAVRKLMEATNLHAVTVPDTFWPEQQLEAAAPLLPEGQSLIFIVNRYYKVIGYRVGDYVRDSSFEPDWQPNWVSDLMVSITDDPMWKDGPDLFIPVSKLCRLVGSPLPAGYRSIDLSVAKATAQPYRQAGRLQPYLDHFEFYVQELDGVTRLSGFGIGSIRVFDPSDCGRGRLFHSSRANDRWTFQHVIGINAVGLLRSPAESLLLTLGLQGEDQGFLIKEENADKKIEELYGKPHSQELVVITDNNKRVVRFEMLTDPFPLLLFA